MPSAPKHLTVPTRPFAAPGMTGKQLSQTSRQVRGTSDRMKDHGGIPRLPIDPL
jgi:hypothetical protein